MPKQLLPADRQRFAVLDAANQVADIIDDLTISMRMAEGGAGGPSRSLRTQLTEASERLVNLLSLLHFHSMTRSTSDNQDDLRVGLEALRIRFLETARSIATARATGIIRRAASVTSGRANYALGIAERLGYMMAEIDSLIYALGGLDCLSEDDQLIVEEARDSVVRLRQVEIRLGGCAMLLDLTDPENLDPTDEASLNWEKKAALPPPRDKLDRVNTVTPATSQAEALRAIKQKG